MAKDIYHETVREALIADGWTITHDPFPLSFGGHNMYVDLGAERMLAAERGNRLIAVEVKSFIGRSEVHDLELALGQYMLYRGLMKEEDAERTLYLGVSRTVFEGLFQHPLGRFTIEEFHVKMLVFDPDERKIHRWIE
ncbi:MAG: XisH family protein [Chloroflexi bacterium]|nr:XisH family protein [Chloroflexota bacterium]